MIGLSVGSVVAGCVNFVPVSFGGALSAKQRLIAQGTSSLGLLLGGYRHGKNTREGAVRGLQRFHADSAAEGLSRDGSTHVLQMLAGLRGRATLFGGGYVQLGDAAQVWSLIRLNIHPANPY